MAQPFDAQRLELTGEAFPIAEQIQTHSVGELYANFSASENGVLVYQTGTAAGGSQLTWFDRSGKQIGVLGRSGSILQTLRFHRMASELPSAFGIQWSEQGTSGFTTWRADSRLASRPTQQANRT